MRIKDDCTYLEYKEAVTDAFHLYEEDGFLPEQVTDYLEDEDWTSEMKGTTSAFMWFVSIAVREIELGILEDRVLAQISFHIPLYEQGEYHDLDFDEKDLLEKDLKYIRTNIKLIPKNELKKT
ncbi:MAG: hypothetical protein IJH64_08470 [Oscillospiraceae bacterium]|nr:hypothetical protein [Oscillospiraceae bacterium]